MRNDELLISMREMAELANVKRPVVSTWARRHADFPQPVSGDHRQPLYNAREYADWLVSTGRAEKRDVYSDLQSYTLVRLAGDFSPRALVAGLTSLICLRHVNDDEQLDDGTPGLTAHLHELAEALDPEDTTFLEEITGIRSRRLPAVVDNLIEAAWGTGNAFQRVMDLRERLGSAELAAVRLDPELVRLVAALADAPATADRFGELNLADPFAGAGDLVCAVIDTLRDDQTVHVAAACASPYLSRLTRRRLTVSDLHEGSFEVRDDTVGLEDAHIIVADLPFQPSEARSVVGALETISDLAVQLRPGATAVLIAPADTIAGLEPYSEAGQIRAGLLPNTVKAIIRLPGGLVRYRPGYEVALWVLNADRASKLGSYVLLADVSDRRLTRAVADALIIDVVTWRNEGFDPDAHARTYARPVPAKFLQQSAQPFTPRILPNELQYSHDVPERVARTLDLERILWQARPERARLHSNLELKLHPAPPRTATLGELTRGGREHTNLLAIQKGMRLKAEHVQRGNGIQPERSHPVIGPPELLGRSALGGRRVDRIDAADAYPKAKLSEPGDVIITTSPEPAVFVDHDGYALVEFPARSIRITEKGKSQFTPRVLAALLAQSGRAAGAVRPVQRLEEIRLPLVPPDELERFDRLLTGIDERRRAALQEIDALNELQQIAATGLTDGTLTITHGQP